MQSPLLAGFALAASAGLNAYIPLLVLAIAGRASNNVDLVRPYGFLGSTLSIAILLALLTIEIFVDKIPRAASINDLIQSVLRPASGALALMAVTRAANPVNPLVVMIIGLVIASAVHVYKMTSRPAISAATKGLGDPMVSMVEDGLASITAVAAVLLPVAGIVCAIVSGFLLRAAYRIALRFGRSRFIMGPAFLHR